MDTGEVKVTAHHIKIATVFLMFQYLNDVKDVTKSRQLKNKIDKLVHTLWKAVRDTEK